MIEILDPGLLATVQDAGRPGYAALGVARSGAFDRQAYTLGNRLVGNPVGAASIELTLGGLTLRVLDAVTVCLTGAACPAWTGAPRHPGPRRGRAPRPPIGRLRSYLAIRGGLTVAAELGSRSTDTLGGLGPPPLRAGDQLAVGNGAVGEVSGTAAIVGSARSALRVLAGRATRGSSTGSTSWWRRAGRCGPVPTGGPAARRAATASGDRAGAAQRGNRARRGAGSSGRAADPVRPDAPVTGGYP